MKAVQESSEMDSRVESYLEAVENNCGLLNSGTGSFTSLLSEKGIEFEIVGTMTRDYAGMSGGQQMEIIKHTAQERIGVILLMVYIVG